VSVTEKARLRVRCELRRRTQVNHRSSVEIVKWCQNQGDDVALG